MPISPGEILSREFWESIKLSGVSDGAAGVSRNWQSLDEHRRAETHEAYQGCATGYNITACLGKGAQAVVLEATNDAYPGRLFALKKFLTLDASLRQERAISLHEGKLQDPTLEFLVPVFAVVQDQTCPGQKIIVMDKAIGTLGDYLRRCGGHIPRDECRRIFYQLLAGLAELNRLAIVHRDIQPDNVLFYKLLVHDPSDGSQKSIVRAKIGDFGFARELCGDDKAESHLGTDPYMAPEFFETKKLQYASEVDVWSTGAVLLKMVCGQVPFASDVATARHKTHRTQAAIDRQLSSVFSKDADDKLCKQVLQRCLVVTHPHRRAQAHELLNLKWLESCHAMPSMVSAPTASQLGMRQELGLMSTFATPSPQSGVQASASSDESVPGGATEGSSSSNDTTMAEAMRESPSPSSQDALWSQEQLDAETHRHENLGRLIAEQKRKRAMLGI